MLNEYFQDIFKTHKTGDATEASYYSDLKKLFESFLRSKGIDPNITIQPRLTKAGIPDFIIRKDKELIGYVEAKDLKEDLNKIESSEQIKKYKEKLPNFILTNYFDFWLWRRDGIDDKNGRWIKKVKIGEKITLRLNTPPLSQNEKDFSELLQAFFSYYIPERKTPKSLAKELANRANLIPSQIVYLLSDESEEEIDRIYNAFTNYLIADLSKEDFADIYAQTIAYGLFIARLRQKNDEKFDRFIAERLIPKNIQILHDTFSLISSGTLPEAIASYVDDIATVLAHADIEKIKKELHREKGGDDPLMHFYETFLAEYDPQKRKARGVYYTPLPVVSYITRSINILLKEKFGKKLGFASEGITLLDPASGTLTFPANAVAIAKEETDKSPNAGSWLQIVKSHILKDYYAFELLMAPYIVGHLKISLLLESLGYKLENGERFKLYLTNTLDFEEHLESNLPGFPHALTEESREALKVKKEKPILVIMGNPPYSVSSSNIIKEGTDFYSFYESYKETVRKEEKNIQPLSDDYIKFIAFAHWKIKQTGQGIVGMITNNSYLDGLIHRDMRRKLAEDFDEIYILNLHGSSKRNEKTPEGGKDENVFDIQQGVGIIILIKKEGLEKKINYFDLYGLREEKYKFLEGYDVKNTKYQELKLKESHYWFVPKDFDLEKIYKKFFSMEDIFSSFSAGVVTSRDKLLVDSNPQSLRNKLNRFFDKNYPTNLLRSEFDLKDTGTWKLENARKSIIDKGVNIDLIFTYDYRPFDKHLIYYDPLLIERDRRNIMSNLQKANLSLCVMKRVLDNKWKDVFISQHITDYHYIGGQTYIFPLFIYLQNNENNLFQESGIQQPNFNPKFWQTINPSFIETVDPWSIFYYIYAILYSNDYRQKYNEFLKIDFPRIPFTEDDKLFYKIAELGKELVDLHLLKSERLNETSAKFPISTGDVLTDGKVKKREYREKERRIYINDKQYFEGVEPEIWNYYIGGYQVLDKWLKDRIDTKLSPEDVNYYLKIITALKWTIYFQKEIDKLYPELEKNLIE
jgi:hypothetical protein